jgi:hypothetical protein
MKTRKEEVDELGEEASDELRELQDELQTKQ